MVPEKIKLFNTNQFSIDVTKTPQATLSWFQNGELHATAEFSLDTLVWKTDRLESNIRRVSDEPPAQQTLSLRKKTNASFSLRKIGETLEIVQTHGSLVRSCSLHMGKFSWLLSQKNVDESMGPRRAFKIIRNLLN